MGFGVSEETLPDKGLTEKKLDIFFRPAAGGQSLQEHHDFLKIHFQELVGPFDQESGAYIEMEVRESLVLGLRVELAWLKIKVDVLNIPDTCPTF